VSTADTECEHKNDSAPSTKPVATIKPQQTDTAMAESEPSYRL
jgi:hypothetical protein